MSQKAVMMERSQWAQLLFLLLSPHLPFAQRGSHGELLLLPTHTHSLAEMNQEEKQQQKGGTSRRDERMVSHGTGAFPIQATSVSVYSFIARYA